MIERHLDILDGTDYEVNVFRSEDGYDEIDMTVAVYDSKGILVDHDLLAHETMYGGVTEEAIKNFVHKELSKAKRSANLYGKYTGKKENN